MKSARSRRAISSVAFNPRIESRCKRSISAKRNRYVPELPSFDGIARACTVSTTPFPTTKRTPPTSSCPSFLPSFISSPSLNAQSIELISLRKLPDSFCYSLNGIVASRAVKFLGKLHSTLVDKETRDSWWEALRDEVRANTLRIGADLVLGYRETCSIHDDVCVLSATGTAVKLEV